MSCLIRCTTLAVIVCLTSPMTAQTVIEDFDSVSLYTLENANGVQIKVTQYGGIVTSIRIPDRNGVMADVALGYDSLEQYINAPDKPYFGAIVGRYGNRIAKGEFTIDGEKYPLATNNGPNHLHGGNLGFDKVIWDIEPKQMEGRPGLELSYTARDGEEGYPGNLSVTVTYQLTDDNEWVIQYSATTDAPTPVNLTQHTYFNLAGEGSKTVLDHELMIAADHFTPVDETLIPTGVLQPVESTPFDFRVAKTIGRDIEIENQQLAFGLGYDHNFVLSGSPGREGLTLAARVTEPTSGRTLEVHTTEPGIQFYCGNFLDGRLVGKSGRPYQHRSGFCLETQHFPDSPNQDAFPTTILRPGERYESTTVYRFGVTPD
ncbi:MAG: aldose epimerase family protein [Planctomycetota bacterium]